jgi:hypothetical protein
MNTYKTLIACIILSVKFRTGVNSLDISHNELTGTIPTELGTMSALLTIDAYGNRLEGTIPNEMVKMNPNLRLNFTNNL